MFRRAVGLQDGQRQQSLVLGRKLAAPGEEFLVVSRFGPPGQGQGVKGQAGIGKGACVVVRFAQLRAQAREQLVNSGSGSVQPWSLASVNTMAP